MAKQCNQNVQEKFRTMIGGQALIEGIMMRGPEKDAIVVRKDGQIHTEVKPRKKYGKYAVQKWPLIRGVVSFFDAQVTGVKALMRSADLSPEETQETSRFEQWLEKKLGNARFQSLIIGLAVTMGIGMSVLLFFLLPMLVGSLFDRWIDSTLLLNLLEGAMRIAIFICYILLVSRMSDMKRVFAYHGAEHKVIRCYEAGLPLTVENAREQTRLHPRCGTSFLLIVMILSILIFSVASGILINLVPELAAIHGTGLYRLIMISFKLLLLPVVVAVSYEANRWVGRHNNGFCRILTAPGMWFQNFTTNEPDDSMLEVGIAALEAVIPEEEGADRW